MFPKLCKQSLRISAYVDSFFAKKLDLFSLLGHKCLLEDYTGAEMSTSFRLHRYRKVSSSVMASKLIVFSRFFDTSNMRLAQLTTLDGRKVRVQQFTDS